MISGKIAAVKQMQKDLSQMRYTINKLIGDCQYLLSEEHPPETLDAPEEDDTGKDGEFDLEVKQRRNRIELDE